MRADLLVFAVGFGLLVHAGACSGSSDGGDDDGSDDAGTCPQSSSSSGSSGTVVCPGTANGGPGGGSSGASGSSGGSSGAPDCLSGYVKSCRDPEAGDKGGCIEAYNVDSPPILGCNQPAVEGQLCDRSTALGGCLRPQGEKTCFLTWSYEEAEPGNIEKSCALTGGVYVPPP